MQIKQLLKAVLDEICPEFSRLSEAEEFLRKLNQSFKKSNLPAKAVFGGSYAKNTWLKGDYDVDIFVKFKPSLAHKDISNILGKPLKKFQPIRIHGSRDYFHVKNKIRFEIVPVLDIKKSSDAHNVTDFSPLHVEWVNEKGKKLKNQIRLTKKFMKAQRVYGAESYIRGFSGHVVDILTIHYGGFLELLKSTAQWKPKTVIDPNKIYRGKNIGLVLNKSKIEGPLIVIDPLQPERNAAAAVSEQRYFEFISASKNFLKKPSKKFFVEKQFNLEKIKKKKNAFIIKATPIEGKEDSVGTKLLKAFEFFKEKLNDFGIVDSGWNWNNKDKKAFFWYALKKNKLPSEKIIKGPPLILEVHAKNFKKSHEQTFKKGNRLYAKIKISERTPAEMWNKKKKDSYLKNKVKLSKHLLTNK